jgi:hypothetical protein
MIRRVIFGFVTAALVGTLLMAPTPAEAKTCSTNGDCDPGNTCAVIFDFWLFKWKECRRTPCNTDGDCRGGTLCLLGVCQAGCRGEGDCPAGTSCSNSLCTGPSPHPAAGTIPGEGRKCTPADGSRPPGWATDSHGKPLGACPHGTSCSSRGYCQRLEQ